MKKAWIICFLLCIGTAAAQESFVSNILDSSQAYMNPSVAIDSGGVGHYFWSNGTNLIYTTSTDTSKRTTLFTTYQQLGNIQSVIDSHGIIHIVFSVYEDGYKYYYMNSNGWKAIDLNINYYENTPAIAIAPDNTLYIALVGALPGQEEDIILLTSRNFTSFSYQWLQKPSVQLQPSLAVDAKGTVHLAWFDWREGASGGVGQYKVRYSNSSSNFQDEKVIAISGQSYNPSIKLDKNGGVFIALKDAGDSGLGFDGGYVYIYDMALKTFSKITDGVITFMQDRPLGFSIDSLNVKHVVWSELANNWENVSIKYANSKELFKNTLQDTSYLTDLGYVSIDTFGDKPTILANIHSIASYNLEETPEPNCSCEELQQQIDELKDTTNDLKKQVETLSGQYSLLDSLIGAINIRLSIIEEIINSTRQFPLFNGFWVWRDSPKECFAEDKKCEGADRYICVDYAWSMKETCQYGCTSGVCNPIPKENCYTKPDDYVCSGSYSKKLDYYGCTTGHGTTTSCDIGFCKASTRSTYCVNGCNNLTRRCA